MRIITKIVGCYVKHVISRSKTSLLTNSENSKKIKNQGRKKKTSEVEESASKKVKVNSN